MQNLFDFANTTAGSALVVGIWLAIAGGFGYGWSMFALRDATRWTWGFYQKVSLGRLIMAGVSAFSIALMAHYNPYAPVRTFVISELGQFFLVLVSVFFFGSAFGLFRKASSLPRA